LSAESARQAERQARDEVQKRYDRFLDHRKETLFRDTRFTGLMLPTNLDLTRRAAEAALAVFAKHGDEDDWTLGALPAELSSRQRTEVKEGCYELLLVLADAVAAQGSGQVDRALRILDSADRLRPEHSRAYHLRKASLLAAKNDSAGEARERALAQHVRPQTAFDHFLSGQQEYKLDRLADAVQSFESTLRTKPDHFWAKCLLAICYIQTTRFEAAKSSLDGCLQADRDFAWLYLLRGFASGQEGAKYQKLVKDSPGREAGLKEKAEFQFDLAEADFQDALERLKKTPDDDLHYVLLINRGLIRFERRRLDQAAADYQEAVGLNKAPFLAHAELAHVYQQQDKTAQALEQFTRAIALKPDWSPLYRGRAEVVRVRADATPQERRAALDDLKMAILHEKPDNPVVALDHVNRSELLFRDGRYEDALEESKLALGILADHVDARVVIDANVLQIRSLLKLKRVGEVIHACDVAIAKGKKSALIYELRGQAEADRNDYLGAIRDYGRALEIRPDDARLLAQRGWAYVVYDAPKLALADFEAALKLEPANSDFYTGRGTAKALLGDHGAAVADARAALRNAAADPRVTYNAARIYAIAASVAGTALGEKGRQARQLSTKYEDIAVQLIRERIEREAPEKRAALWRQTVLPDPALKAIRRRLRFEDLIVTTK
jgi:tetratricopeptide (TPR) repeat protein